MRDAWTYRINESSEILLHHILVFAIIDSDRSIHGHQTMSVVFLLTKGVEREFEVGRRNETGQYTIAKNGQAAIQLTPHQKMLELSTELSCGDKGRVGDVNDPPSVRRTDNVTQLSVGEWL